MADDEIEQRQGQPGARRGNSGAEIEELRNFNRPGSVSQIEFPKFPTKRS
jgi:hypothetical protein